jgi:CHAD domain-containing protein
MRKGQTRKSQDTAKVEASLTVGEYAHQVVGQHYHHFVGQEQAVLADTDPEPLHQMRVGIRRLRTALKVFDIAIQLPKAATDKHLRNLARSLGELRDLDVQIACLQDHYHPRLSKSGQGVVSKALINLNHRRTKIVTKVETLLSQPDYQRLKAAYLSWLEHPDYTTRGTLPVLTLLPDLLSPLLSALLLHPGWLISVEMLNDANLPILHDLRKACKRARYQAEFFIPFYGQEFQAWIKAVKELQERLGDLQDTQVLTELLSHEVGSEVHWSEVEDTIAQRQVEIMSGWDPIRQQYLEPGFRYHLHQIVLQPELLTVAPPSQSEDGPTPRTRARRQRAEGR